MQHGKNNVDVDGAVGSATHKRMGGSFGLESRQRTARLVRFGRYHDGLAPGQYSGGGSRLRITGAEMAPFGVSGFAFQKALRIGRRDPVALLGNTDGHDFKLVLVDGMEDRGGRKQRDFMFATASAK